MGKNNDTLSICNKKKMYVVIPSIVGDYLDIKNNLTNGSIILLNDMNNLDIIVKYINSKGYSKREAENIARDLYERDCMRFYQILNEAIGEHD